MDNKNAEIRNTNRGKGLFTKTQIKQGEIVAEFDGRIYSYRSKLWNQDLYHHCIQFEENRWRDSKGVARLLNHSCEPNCGIKGLFTIVAMKNIPAGTELTWDYEMTEDHPYWRLTCRCGTKSCRKIIGTFQNMPEKIRKKYKGFISEWLVNKYQLT